MTFDDNLISHGSEVHNPRTDRNRELYAWTLAKWEQRKGPRVGDYITDGTRYARFTYKWETAGDIQTTYPINGPDYGGSFYIGRDGFASFSGSLLDAIPLANIEPTDETRPGAFWFFHNGSSGAHRGITVMLPCRVFRTRPGTVTYSFSFTNIKQGSLQ